jgi:hypothetical protein
MLESITIKGASRSAMHGTLQKALTRDSGSGLPPCAPNAARLGTTRRWPLGMNTVMETRT